MKKPKTPKVMKIVFPPQSKSVPAMPDFTVNFHTAGKTTILTVVNDNLPKLASLLYGFLLSNGINSKLEEKPR